MHSGSHGKPELLRIWLFLEPLVSGRNLVRSPSAERGVRSLLAMEAFTSQNTQNKRITASEGHLSSTWCYWRGRWKNRLTPVGLPTALEEIRCGTSPAVCSRLSAMLTHILVG